MKRGCRAWCGAGNLGGIVAERRLSILIYHRVLPRPDPLQPEIPTSALFERHMRWLSRVYNVLALGEAVTRLRDGTLPSMAVAVTFDDGYADNYEVALPILRRLGVPATFFVASGFLDGGRMWNDAVIETVRAWRGDELTFGPLGMAGLPMKTGQDRRRAIDRLLTELKHRPLAERDRLVSDLANLGRLPAGSPMMTSEQVRALHRAGMTVGGHTRWHPILKVLTDEDAKSEILGGKTDLEELLGEPVDLFAYPNGRPHRDFDARHSRMVADLGFRAAVTTAWGAADSDTDPFRLPRFTPWDSETWKFILRLGWCRVGGVA